MYTNLYSWCSHNNRECKFLGLQAMEAFFQEVRFVEWIDRLTDIFFYFTLGF